MPRKDSQSVTGIVVNHASRLSKAKAYRDNIRAASFALKTLEGPLRVSAEKRICGQIAYVRSIHPAAAARLSLMLQRASTQQRPTT